MNESIKFSYNGSSAVKKIYQGPFNKNQKANKIKSVRYLQPTTTAVTSQLITISAKPYLLNLTNGAFFSSTWASFFEVFDVVAVVEQVRLLST